MAEEGRATTRVAPTRRGRKEGARARRRRDSSAPLRCARNDMWGSAGRNGVWGRGMGPRIREDNGWGVFTGAGSLREGRRGELEGEGRREWPKRDGRPLGSPLRGEGGRRARGREDDEIPRLRCAALGMTCGGALVGMTCGGRGWVPAPRLHGGRISTRGQRVGCLHEGRLCAGRTEGRA